jgi:glycosyltransferase involved in cell wall biosynthesis
MNVSIIIPAYNEADSVQPLLDGIAVSMSKKYGSLEDLEIIFVDDGSNDGTVSAVEKWSQTSDVYIKLLCFGKNRGKSAALAAAFSEARGAFVVTIDADLQDEPNEIGNLIDHLGQGYDLVSGWKRSRNDPISKTLPSRLFNWVTGKISGVKLHDFNCGLKAYRLDVVKNLNIYGELHRYIPVLAAWEGYSIAELAVVHHPRRYGVSKFGSERYLRGLLDLGTVVFLQRYSARPLHLFGGLGISMMLVGFSIELYLTFLWFLGQGVGTRPILFLGMLLIIAGLQSFFFGLLAEMLTNNFVGLPKYSLKRLEKQSSKK